MYRESTVPQESELASLTLGAMEPGQHVRILGYNSVSRAHKKRLLALGLTPGTEVHIERTAPFGDPLQIRVRGFHLGLRRSEAEALRVVEVAHA